MPGTSAPPTIAAHGAKTLPAVIVDSYNLEVENSEGFFGDHASKGALRGLIDNWRKPLRQGGDDPFGDMPSHDLGKKDLDQALEKSGNLEAAGVAQGVLKDFSQELARVIRCFLKLKAWKDTERIVIGGGFRASRVGEIAIGRTSVILKAENIDIDIHPIRNDPDDAGLIGAVQLVPKWFFKSYEAIVGIDIGGSNIRAGIVDLNIKKASDLSKARVWKSHIWHHSDEEDVNREDAVDELIRRVEN